jgi:hypothetical protein
MEDEETQLVISFCNLVKMARALLFSMYSSHFQYSKGLESHLVPLKLIDINFCLN